MKKTIIALMALAGLSMASDEFNGLTFDNTDKTGSGASSMLGFTFTLKAESSDYTVTNTMEIEFPKVLTLTEVSFDKAFVYNKSSKYGEITSKDVYLYITDNAGTILGISEATSVSASTDGNNTGEAVTFTLDCDNIQTGNEYRVWFMGSDSSFSTSDTGVQTISLTDASTVELRSASSIVATTGDLKLLTDKNGAASNYTFTNMSIKAIPEPTTATLSLLALAGLAARRRRK